MAKPILATPTLKGNNHKGFHLEFKIKKNRDGYFLYHLKII